MTPSARRSLIIVCLGTAMLMLDIAVVNTALSSIASDLNASLDGLQWVFDAYTLPLAALVLTAGSLADRLGRRRIFEAGLVLFTVSSLACALSESILMLDIARAFQGTGAALMFASSLALLAAAFPGTNERATALAAYGATIGAAFAIGPLIGGGLTSLFGWRAIFFVNIPIGIAVIAGTRAWVSESRDSRSRRLDWAGQTTLAAGLFLIVLALLRGNQDGWGSTAIVTELVAGALLLVAFVIIQTRVAEPMLPLRMFRVRTFAGAQVAAFTIAGSFWALYLYLTLYVQEVVGLSPIETGLAYLPGTMMLFIVAGFSGELMKKISPGVLVIAGLSLVAVGLALALLVGEDSAWTIILPASIVMSIGGGLYNPPGVSVALSSATEDDSGLASGVLDTFRQTGTALGVAVYGALVPAAAAVGQGPAKDYVDGLHTAVLVAIGVCIAGTIATALLIRPRWRTSAAPVTVAPPVAESVSA